MRWYRRSAVLDGYEWRCRDCDIRKSIREDSYFFSHHISMKKVMEMMYLWSFHVGYKSILEMTGLSTDTVSNWLQYFRDICGWKLLQPGIVQIGGNQVVVEIDESQFIKRKHN